MGGLSHKRLRLQGRIEGNVNRLNVQRNKFLENTPDRDSNVKKNKRDDSVSPPPAPVVIKRRLLDLNDDDNDEVERKIEVDEMIVRRKKEKRVLRKGAVRKLGDDFERVANFGSEIKGAKKKLKGENVVISGTRTSHRLAKG